MDQAEFRQALLRAIEQHHRRDHPFFRSWASGALPVEAIRGYVQQHHYLATNVLPTFAIASGLTELADVRAFLMANLREEEDPEEAHDDLLIDLGVAVGLTAAEGRNGPLLPTTEGLIDFLFATLIRRGALHFVAAACVGLESQGPAMYRAVIPAMRDHYAIADEDMVFLTLHVEADEEHGAGALRLIERHASDESLQLSLLDTVARAARKGWFHLDGLWMQYVEGHNWVAARPAA